MLVYYSSAMPHIKAILKLIVIVISISVANKEAAPYHHLWPPLMSVIT